MTSVFSHALGITSFARRKSDNKVVIKFRMVTPGIYYMVRSLCRAYPPGDNVGFSMTPDVLDPLHFPDPIVVSSPSVTYTWVWDAPKDGYAANSLSGWTLYLGYANIYCCTLERDGWDPQPPGPDDPGDPVAPPTEPPVVAGDTTVTTDPVVQPTPVPDPSVPPPVTTTPSSPSTDSFFGFKSPYDPLATVGTSTPTTTSTTPTTKTSSSFSRFSFTSWRQKPSYVTPSVKPATTNTSTQEATAVRSLTTSPAPATTSSTGSVNDSLFFGYGITKVDPTIPQISEPVNDSHYSSSWWLNTTTLDPHPMWDIKMTMIPGSSSPINSTPLLFTTIFFTGGGYEGFKIYVEGKDSNGKRLVFEPGAVLDTILPEDPPEERTRGIVTCVKWQDMAVGPAQIMAALVRPDGKGTLSKIINVEILPEGEMPIAARAPSELPTALLQKTGLPGDTTPKFTGVCREVGDFDLYKITAVDRTSFVVTMTKQGEQTGFAPKLDIFLDDLGSPVLSTTARLTGLSDEDNASHSVSWVDESGLLTPGQTYRIKVSHQYLYYAEFWSYSVYTNATVAAPVMSLLSSGGTLGGTLTSPYCLATLKAINDRTGGSVFLNSTDQGLVTLPGAIRPFGDTLGALPGDVIKVYRPGIQYLYSSTDEIARQTL
jgi:hypothetical protein